MVDDFKNPLGNSKDLMNRLKSFKAEKEIVEEKACAEEEKQRKYL